MLPDLIKSEILTAYQAIKSKSPNFRDRFQQRKMVASVSNALSGTGKPIVMIEGPTGTGKTMAYLLGAIPVAKHLDKRLVVASATIALQEQLLNKDIPLIQKYTDYKFNVQLAKGRGRYVCLTRLSKLSGESNQGELIAETAEMAMASWSEPPDKKDVLIIKKLFKDLKDGKWNGDIDNASNKIPYQLWGKINNNFHSCIGSKCQDYHRCIFYNERKKLGSADIIIANHDLILADISGGGESKILPPVEDSLYVFDEAHHLPLKAVNHFSAQSEVLGAIDWVKTIPKAFIKEVSGMQKTKIKITEIAVELTKGLQQMHQLLSKNTVKKTGNYDNDVRFPFGKPPAYILEVGESEIWAPLKQLKSKLSIAVEMVKKDLDKDGDDNVIKEQQMTVLGFLLEKVENLYNLWFLMLKSDDKNQAPYARWLTPKDDDFILNVAPISASLHLQTNFWDKTIGCVLTSATLTALNSFDRIKELTGLSDKNTEFVRLSSPFNLSKVHLNIPKMQYPPSSPNEHTAEIVQLLPKLLSGCLGNLVLFSSHKQMEEVYQSLSNKYKQAIQVQSKNSLENILKQHKENIKNQELSILFGVSSFSEGLDLPGELCEHVIIAKIPFAVPTSPREEAYSEWVESLGKNPFFTVSVPDASIRLTQACGRLIRSENDIGTITILDNRLDEKRYGQNILNALPSYTINTKTLV